MILQSIKTFDAKYLYNNEYDLIIMRKTVSNNYMHNFELQSLHYWFKNSPFQNPSIKYKDLFQVMQDEIKTDISNFIHVRSHLNFHNRLILKNVFGHWKMYVVHKLHRRRITYKANYFYQMKLQRKVLNAFSKNVLLKWEQIVSSMDKCSDISEVSSECRIARAHYSQFLLRKSFKYWRNYIEIMDKEKALLEKAVHFHDSYCLKKCITNWKIFLMLQRKKRYRAEQARKWYEKKVLEKSIRVWTSISELESQRCKVERALRFCNDKLLIKYFRAWRTYHDYKIKKLNTELRVSAYSRKRLLKQYFKLFVVRVNESIAENIANENADTFYNSKLVQRTFDVWREWHDRKLLKTMKIREIKRVFENGIKRDTYINWRAYVIRKKCKRRQMFAANRFYEKKLSMKIFRSLRDYALYRKEKRAKLPHVYDRSEGIVQQLQTIFIERWRRALYNSVQEKQKLAKAIQLWELNLAWKYFNNWREFSLRYKEKMLRKQSLNEIADSFLLTRFIVHWRYKLQGVLDIRRKEVLAVSTMENRITKKCFSSWREYIAQKVKLNEDIEAAMELHKKFLLREGLKSILKNSLCNIDYQRDVQLENAVMRSLENLEILKEYFDKWHSLIYLKSKSELTSGNDLARTRDSCYGTFDSFRTRLVLPEYMMDKGTKVCDSISKLPQENWLFNLFQPF